MIRFIRARLKIIFLYLFTLRFRENTPVEKIKVSSHYAGLAVFLLTLWLYQQENYDSCGFGCTSV